jgi:5-methyltetrahydropteroyltriglutamate--homocysteine methyltransferase
MPLTGELARIDDELHGAYVVLKLARRPESELEALREVKPQLGLGTGVIDVKETEVETPDRVARRIERAARCLGRERIEFVHPDWGLWMLPRGVADAKLQALVAGRDLFDHGGAAGP